MKQTWIPGSLLLLAILVCALWLGRGGAPPQPLRLPGGDGAPAQAATESGAAAKVIFGIPAGARLITGVESKDGLYGAWPCFRGEARDNVCRDDTPLARTWPAGGPPVLWDIGLGQGHAGAAVTDGRVCIFDYDEPGQRDAIRCLSLADATEIWSYSYPMPSKPNHGISRTVPAVAGGFLVAMGPQCQVSCLDAKTGAFRWRLDPVKQFGIKVPSWYAGQCLLIDKGKAIIAIGSKDMLLMAAKLDTGQVLWTTPNLHGSQMTHSSIVPMDFEDRRLYIYAGTNGVVGVSAEDGSVVFQSREFKWHTIAPSPLILPGGRIIFTAGYGSKALLAGLHGEDGAISLKVLKNTAPRVFGAEQHTPIFYQDHLYCVLPKPRQELVCMDPELGEIWASGQTVRFGLGPYLIADGLIFVMDDDGNLTMAEASPKGYKQLASHKVLPGPDSWGPMAMVKGRLIVRDLYRMKCLDLRSSQSGGGQHE